MATRTDIQDMLRFLTTTAKLPLATAMGKMKELLAAGITQIEHVTKADVAKLESIFGDEKTAKQVLNAAKRTSKKREAPSASSTAQTKKRTKTAQGEILSPADMEASLALPDPVTDEETLAKTVLITNRAPLVLAFAVTLLKYTLPDQPLSSRLSLAQAWLSASARDRAVSLGIESGKSAEEEGFGQGQPVVRIMGRDVHVMRRWGYDPTSKGDEPETQATQSTATEVGNSQEEHVEAREAKEPPLWGIDLEALRKSATQQGQAARNNLPIHTPQSARAYLLKAFNSPTESAPEENRSTSKKGQKTADSLSIVAQRERNLGRLLGALDLLYESWSPTLSPEELDKRTWNWYASVRPEVADGVDGWGGRNEVRLENILKLRRHEK
ncbi:uncharacterized protein PV09_01267 [Verruconis gallopava]|uniref:Impact N-terminal domain-containing protein n=1 Tax=Verruconis gallopava TaxID=253628 RepID=A0A0D1XZW3_9PEZI|nr:uncharacterized protein PV09_01267 [Verruconis gallopava]KIW08351.1 hypothetical protein PV09_01267 [Verruconis gallopava]